MLLALSLSASDPDPVIPDFAQGLPDVVMTERIKDGNTETLRLRTGLSAKEFTGRIRGFMKKAGWRVRKLTKDDMMMAAQKGRAANAEVHLLAFDHVKHPGNLIRVVYLRYKSKNTRPSVEIIVHRPLPPKR